VFLLALAGFCGWQQYSAQDDYQKCSTGVNDAQFQAILYRIDRSRDASDLTYLKLSKQMLDDRGLSATASQDLEKQIDNLEAVGSRGDRIDAQIDRIRKQWANSCDELSTNALWSAVLTTLVTALVGVAGFDLGKKRSRSSAR
jgi:hypothetical protein